MTPGRVSVAVLIAGAVVCFAVAFHIGTIGIASWRDWTILYVALPAGLGLLPLAALLLRPAGRTAFAATAFAALAAILIADIYLAMTDPASTGSSRSRSAMSAAFATWCGTYAMKGGKPIRF